MAVALDFIARRKNRSLTVTALKVVCFFLIVCWL